MNKGERGREGEIRGKAEACSRTNELVRAVEIDSDGSAIPFYCE